MEPETHHPQPMSKAERWKRHLERQQTSNLTQVAYCQQAGIKVATFQYWKRRLSDVEPSASRLRLVPIQPPNPSWGKQTPVGLAGPSWIRLHFRDLILEVPEDISVSRLQRLVAGLREGTGHVAH